LVWFKYYFKGQLDQTKPHVFLSRGLDDFYLQNQTKPHRSGHLVYMDPLNQLLQLEPHIFHQKKKIELHILPCELLVIIVI